MRRSVDVPCALCARRNSGEEISERVHALSTSEALANWYQGPEIEFAVYKSAVLLAPAKMFATQPLSSSTRMLFPLTRAHSCFPATHTCVRSCTVVSIRVCLITVKESVSSSCFKGTLPEATSKAWNGCMTGTPTAYLQF